MNKWILLFAATVVLVAIVAVIEALMKIEDVLIELPVIYYINRNEWVSLFINPPRIICYTK